MPLAPALGISNRGAFSFLWPCGCPAQTFYSNGCAAGPSPGHWRQLMCALMFCGRPCGRPAHASRPPMPPAQIGDCSPQHVLPPPSFPAPAAGSRRAAAPCSILAPQSKAVRGWWAGQRSQRVFLRGGRHARWQEACAMPSWRCPQPESAARRWERSAGSGSLPCQCMPPRCVAGSCVRSSAWLSGARWRGHDGGQRCSWGVSPVLPSCRSAQGAVGRRHTALSPSHNQCLRVER